MFALFPLSWSFFLHVIICIICICVYTHICVYTRAYCACFDVLEIMIVSSEVKYLWSRFNGHYRTRNITTDYTDYTVFALCHILHRSLPNKRNIATNKFGESYTWLKRWDTLATREWRLRQSPLSTTRLTWLRWNDETLLCKQICVVNSTWVDTDKIWFGSKPRFDLTLICTL